MVQQYRIQPSELRALSDEERTGLIQNMPALRARNILDMIDAFGVALATPDSRRGKMTELLQLAYGHDEKLLAVHLELATRRH